MPLAVIDQLEFDNSLGRAPSIVHVSGNIYAVAYSGPGLDGWLVTVSIDSAGNIGATIEASFEFDTASGEVPHIIHISGDIYAIVYEKDHSGGWVITVEIDSAGNITDPILGSLRFFTYVIGIRVLDPYIIHVSGDIYAIVCTDIDDGDGWLFTVDIDNAGNIAGAVVDSHKFDGARGYEPHIIKVSGTTYAIAYDGPGGGWLKTLTIADDGTIAAAPEIDSFEFDTGYCSDPHIVHVSGDIYAIAYRGPSGDGFLKTVDIDAAGNIAVPVINTLEFDTVQCYQPFILELSAGLFAIIYQGSTYGTVITLPIAADGTIGSIVETFAPMGYLGEMPSVVKLSPTAIASAYMGYGQDGWIRTFGQVVVPTVTTNPATSVVADAATLNGTLGDDGGKACTCGFEWGETDAYGNTTPTESKTTGQTFAQTISGLDPNKTYHFTAFATNVAGTSHGADRTFTTLVAAATVTTQPVTGRGMVIATFNGLLNADGGEPCECGFEWGPDIGYGVRTPAETKVTAETFPHRLLGLFPGTEYHYRAFATNSAGTSYGADESFRSEPGFSRAYALAREEL